MHCLEKFSLNSGLKISKPKLLEEYTPNIFDNYILIDSSAENPNDMYPYYDEVIYILRKCFRDNGIKILNNYTRPREELKFSEISFSLSGRQLNYMMKNASLVLTNDNLSLQIAGCLNRKIVALFGSKYINNSEAFFGDKDNQINLEPDSDFKPFFDRVETEEPRRINLIKPEEVAKAVCKLLDVDYIHNYETIYIGESYTLKNGGVECIPDQVIQPPENNPEGLIYRMDLLFNETHLARQLSVGKCVPMTDKPINLDLIETFKENISYLVYKIEQNDHPEFVKSVISMGIKVALVSRLSKEELLPKKLDYMDVGLIKTFEENKKFVDKHENSEIYYKSTRGILSAGKIYASEDAWINGKSIRNRLEPTLCEDLSSISYDLDALYVLKKVD
jgi:hypothetical protein